MTPKKSRKQKAEKPKTLMVPAKHKIENRFSAFYFPNVCFPFPLSSFNFFS